MRRYMYIPQVHMGVFTSVITRFTICSIHNTLDIDVHIYIHIDILLQQYWMTVFLFVHAPPPEWKLPYQTLIFWARLNIDFPFQINYIVCTQVLINSSINLIQSREIWFHRDNTRRFRFLTPFCLYTLPSINNLMVTRHSPVNNPWQQTTTTYARSYLTPNMFHIWEAMSLC